MKGPNDVFRPKRGPIADYHVEKGTHTWFSGVKAGLQLFLGRKKGSTVEKKKRSRVIENQCYGE